MSQSLLPQSREFLNAVALRTVVRPLALGLASLYLHQTDKKTLLSPYFARWAQYGLFGALFRYRSIRAFGYGYCPLGNTPPRSPYIARWAQYGLRAHRLYTRHRHARCACNNVIVEVLGNHRSHNLAFLLLATFRFASFQGICLDLFYPYSFSFAHHSSPYIGAQKHLHSFSKEAILELSQLTGSHVVHHCTELGFVLQRSVHEIDIDSNKARRAYRE